MAEQEIPDGLSADYVNEPVEAALAELNAHPDWMHLAAFLAALGEGFLVVDVTATNKKKATHIRTVRSTRGELVLPVFTSMAELRLAVPKNKRAEVKGAMMPARDALGLITSDRFVAAQLNAGNAALVVQRSFVERILADEPVDAATLESLAT